MAQNMWTIKFDCYKHNYDELSKELDSKVYIYMYFYVVNNDDTKAFYGT